MSESQENTADSQAQGPEGQAPGPQNLFTVAPQFLVADVVATAEYYRDILGFQIGPYARMKDEDPVFFCMVHRDGLFIQLRRSTEGHGESNYFYDKDACDVYFFVKDVESLHRELVDRGATIVSEPEDKFYSMREMNVKDSEGYLIGFGEPIPEEPE